MFKIKLQLFVFIAALFIFILPDSVCAQTSSEIVEIKKIKPAIDGSYQVQIPNIKHVNLVNFSNADLVLIEKNRIGSAENTIRIKDYDVLIMPKVKVDSGVRWAKFALIQ